VAVACMGQLQAAAECSCVRIAVVAAAEAEAGMLLLHCTAVKDSMLLHGSLRAAAVAEAGSSAAADAAAGHNKGNM
jgi:hypothetical protein